jgi:ATP-dependent helicase/nuclease subunit A
MNQQASMSAVVRIPRFTLQHHHVPLQQSHERVTMATSKTTLPKRKPLLELQRQMQIEFLGWNRPILHAACDYLWEHYHRGPNWNLDRMLVVLPGSLAGRRMEVLLSERALREQVVLRPPRFLTLGELPEELYQAKLPFASPLTQTMAWVQVLRAMPLTELQPLLFEVPASEQLGPWMDLAKLLSSLHRELASDLVNFADVAEALQNTTEEARWRVLAQLQRKYLDVLHEAGLWDIQSARRFALEHQEVSRIEHEVVLVGTVDLNRAQRQFLAAIATQVRALVGAPESYAEGFDADGTLRSEFWQPLEIPISQHQIHVRTTVSDAANELALRLALLHGKRRSDEITIGVPDIAIVPTLQETLARSAVALRYGPGSPISQSPPMRVLQALEDYLREQDIQAFTSLVRVPYVYDWLMAHVRWTPTPSPNTETTTAQAATPSENTADTSLALPERFLVNIDKYLNATLLRSASVAHFPEASGREEFVAVLEALENWVRPLRVGKQLLSQWSAPLRSVLLDLFANVQIDTLSPEGNLIARGCREINAVLEKLTKVPPNLDVPVDWSEAIAWVHEQLQAIQLPPQPSNTSIEMIGWLELALDDAPVLMLTGMHDGVIPESVNSDAFLPNRLRSELGLIDNARRYARDAYVMLNLLHTRQELHFIMNRLSADGDPLTPSRLMMAVPSDHIAERVRLLVSNPPAPMQQVEGWPTRKIQSNVPIPPPNPDRSVADMAVTDFKKYSECPYRYYLNRVEKARAFDHPPLELDGGAFGDLVHHVLEGLITAPVAESTDADALNDWLVEALDEEADRRYGAQMPPALIIQLEQAKLRLAAFAEHQAQHAREGWRIRHIEHSVQRGQGIRWELPNGVMEIHGRIDRIDFNERTGEIAVLDYKTGDTSDDPRKIHVKRDGCWVDWQLPLYGQLISTLDILDLSNVKFGYVLLPKNAQQTRFVFADFSLEEHASAIASAKAIAQNVLDRVFWPPSNKLPLDWDDYRWITQRTVVRKWDPSRELDNHPSQPSAAEPVAMEANPTETSTLAHDAPPATTLATTSFDPGLAIAIATESTAASTRSTDAITHHGPASAAAEQPSTHPPSTADQPLPMKLTPVLAQGQAPEAWFSPSMILASAGTGKTYQLASRAIRLLFTEQPLDSILATTFTRKAAGEILHRVLSWLADACETDDGYERLRGILEPLLMTRETVQYQLSRLCSHLHRFRVSTLDSFYAQLAKSFALELQLPPGWTLVDPAQEEQIHREAITRMFDQIEYRHLRSLISQLSKGEAVRGVRAEVEAVVTNGYELFRQAKPEAWQQLYIPAAPSTEEVDDALRILEATEMGTGQRNTAKEKARVQFLERQWDEFLSSTLVTACLDEEPTYNRKPIEPEILAPLNVLRRYALTAALTHRRLQNEAAQQILQKFAACLKDIKTARRLVTFSDVAEKLSRWMQSTVDAYRSREEASAEESSASNVSKPNFESIAHRMDCPVDHLLLDEFQDTSPVQWGIVKPFASAIAENLGNPARASSFFCVGDSKQAIYAWRGGVSEIFESVSQQIRNVREEKLSTSRRSSPVIIDFVNDVFPRLVNHPNFIGEDVQESDEPHPVVSKWLQRYFVPHSTAKQQLSGYIEFRNARCDENKDQEGEKSSHQLFVEVADRVTELHLRAPHHSIGILTRTNADIATLISLLRDRGVEASQEGGNPLTDTAPILLIRSALQLANHPGDSLAHFHILHSPLADQWDPTLREDPHRLAAEIRRELDNHGFGGTVSYMTQTIAPECTERDQQRLQQLIELAYRFDGFRRTQLQEFLDLLDKHKAALPGDSPVRVMTIHQSKGLEFDAVFLPTLDQTIVSRNPDYIVMRADRTSEPIGIMRHMNRKLQRHLPDVWQVAFQESLEQQMGEALCLLYVAITRARQALYLITSPSSTAKKRWGSALHTLLDQEGKSHEPGAILHVAGDPNWVATVDGPTTTPVAPDSLPLPTVRSKLHLSLAPPQTDATIQTRLAPSHLEERQLRQVAELWKPDDIAATIIGKLVHRWFEEIDGWIEDFRPNRKHLQAIAQATLTQEEMSQLKLPEWIDRFLRYCEAQEIRQALSRDRYRDWDVPRVLRLEVTTERRLLQILDGQLIRGIIDRCVLGYDGDRVVRAEILDFKTDQRDERDDLNTWVASRQQAHSPQLNAYRRVLCRQFALHPEQVAMTLVLLSEHRIQPITMGSNSPI